MGIVDATIKVKNPYHPNKFFEGRFLVDTGSNYTVLPKNVWQKLGLKPLRKAQFSLADGTPIIRSVGNAVIQFEKTESAGPVILGEKNDSQILGVVNLETLGLVIDPFTRELRAAKLTM